MALGGPAVGRLVGRLRRAARERSAAPGTVPLDIGAVIVPLRYDVLVRARFFDFLAEHPELTGTALVEAAAGTEYAAWFEHVECARYFPELLEDPRRREERFTDRVLGAARLLASFEAEGFRADRPVTLLSAPAGSVSESGAVAFDRFHIGDGCHRLALLLRAGATLEPWMYKVRAPLGPLVDNTAVLVRRLPVSESDYVAFLGGRFPVGDARTVPSALARVAVAEPASAAALRSVVDAQWRPGGSTEVAGPADGSLGGGRSPR